MDITRWRPPAPLSATLPLPRLHAVLERVSWFAGVEVGRRVRNVREFKEALDAPLVVEDSDGSEVHDQEEPDYCDDY